MIFGLLAVARSVYELGSVPPYILSSVRLSFRQFSWNWLISFSETLYGVWDPYGNVLDRAQGFFEKSPFNKYDQK